MDYTEKQERIFAYTHANFLLIYIDAFALIYE